MAEQIQRFIQITIEEKPTEGLVSKITIDLSEEEVNILKKYKEVGTMQTSSSWDEWTRKHGHHTLSKKEIIWVNSPPPDHYFNYSLTQIGRAAVTELEKQNLL